MDGTEQVVDEQEARLAQASKLYQTAVMLLYGRRKSVEKAIKCVQRAIVLDDKNYKFWQVLGEAYYQRGSLNPAINCFMKSLTLADALTFDDQDQQQTCTRVQSDSIYSRLRMSDIRLSVQHLDEAMQGYGDIIVSDAQNVAALVGMSKAKLLMARNSFHSGLVKSGHVHCMDALKFALRATKLSPNLCFTWKLASDCCLIQILYGQRGEFSTRIDVGEFPGGDQDGGLLITRASCINLAQQFLCKALSIESFGDSACLWHNLGISLYLKGTQFPSQAAGRDSLLGRALKCLLRALDYDRANSQVRNSIAIVAYQMNLLNTSQSFLIKSIQTNMSTSEIQFSNLGYIFLQKGEFRLAGVAFNRCQAEEPLYCRSWLGMALLTENDTHENSNNNSNNNNNMSYLRHCHKLENNHESQMMYATKITSLPHSEEYHRDLVNAMDCMRRVINYDQASLAAQNTLGLLYERCNFKLKAAECFDAAHKLAPDDSRVIFNRLRQQRANQITCVSGTQLMDQPANAELIKMAERLADGGNREYMLNFIAYLFHNGDFASIGARMTRVIESLPQEDVRAKLGAQILLAMAAKAQGSDYKSWLFKNIIDSEGAPGCLESLVNLYGLMLFGAQSEADQQLVSQVMSDLTKCLISYLTTKTAHFTETFYSLEGLWLRLTLASSIFCSPGGGPGSGGAKLLPTMLALFPTIAELWLFQGMALMIPHQQQQQQQQQRPPKTRQQVQQQQQTAVFCIKKARLIGSTNPDLCVICEILLAVLSPQPNARPVKNPAGASQQPNPRERIADLTKALFKCPNYQLLWDCCANPSDRSRDSDLYQLAIDHTLDKLIAN